MRSNEFVLYKIAEDTYDSNDNENLGIDLKQGYQLAQDKGYIPATVLGVGGALSGKGFKNRTVRGLAGVGAGLVGTIAAKAGTDVYKRHKHRAEAERKLKEQMIYGEM